jgi:hypothetical protein
MGDTVRAIEMHVRKILDNISARHRAASAELREGCAAIERVNGVTMNYLRTRDDDDPYYLSPEEEKQMEADAEVERLHTEVAQQASIIADLQEALDEAINYIAVWAVIKGDEKASALLNKCTAALANSRGTP